MGSYGVVDRFLLLQKTEELATCREDLKSQRVVKAPPPAPELTVGIPVLLPTSSSAPGDTAPCVAEILEPKGSIQDEFPIVAHFSAAPAGASFREQRHVCEKESLV